MSKRFLFIGHEATRTGAPIVLLHLLRWLRSNRPDWELDVLLLRGGDLVDEYMSLAKVFVAPIPRVENFPQRAIGKIIRRTPPKAISAIPAARLAKYDGVLGNTIVTLPQLDELGRRPLPTVCWSHELEFITDSFYSESRFSELAKGVGQFIAPSRKVESFLRSRGIRQPIHLAYECSPPAAVSPKKGEMRERFGIPADALVVAGSGTIEWRKGVDLFLQIAAAVKRSTAGIFFIWAGEGGGAEWKKIAFDHDRMHLGDNVFFAGFVNPLETLLADADVFALTSREDPFPLVCLEAAAAGLPIICFDDAGGIPELVGTDAGKVVDYGNITAFADAMIKYNDDRAALTNDGNRAREKAAGPFSADISCGAIARILETL